MALLVGLVCVEARLHPDALLTYCFPFEGTYQLFQGPTSDMYQKAHLLTGEGCQPATNLSAVTHQAGFHRIYMAKKELPVHRTSWLWVWPRGDGSVKYVQADALAVGDRLVDLEGGLHPITKTRYMRSSACFYAHTESPQLVVDQFLVEINPQQDPLRPQ